MVSCGESIDKCLETASSPFSTVAITRAFSLREFTRSFLRMSGVIGTGRSTIRAATLEEDTTILKFYMHIDKE